MFTLGRKIDFNYKTNKIIALAAILVAIIGWIVTKKFSSALSIGGGVFLTWALSREIDPKHDYSAFIAAGLSLLNLVYFESIQLLVIFWILLLMRIVNGITGKQLTVFDIFSVLGLTIYMSFTNKNSVYLIIFILAIAFVIKTGGRKKEALIAGLIGLGVFIAESFFMKYLSFPKINQFNSISVIAFIIIFISFILFWFLSKDEIKDDMGNTVERDKILGSQILYSCCVLLLILFGEVSNNNLIIYLSVIVGVTIYFIGYRFSNKNSSK